MVITGRFAVLLLFGALLVALSGYYSPLLWIGYVYFAIIILTGIIDWFHTPGAEALDAERKCDDKLSIGAKNVVTILFRNRLRTKLKLTIRDEPPYLFGIEENVQQFSLEPRGSREMVYHVFPHARGDFEFGDIYLRICGPMGFVIRQSRIDASRPVKVYPNLLDLRKYELLVRRGRVLESGLRRTRMYGRGTEFESLRDYTPDDEFRQIDWKATSRRGKLMSRHYQVERIQNIMILVDAGRTMSVQIEGLSKLDYSINAALMLAYVAAAGDDRVGVLTFSDNVDNYLPPSKGQSQALAIMETLYNVPLSVAESDYAGAFLYLTKRWRKRSLVVVFSDLLDPESSRQIITHLQTLARGNLCMCVAITDPSVTASSELIPKEGRQLYEKAAAVELLHDRQQAIAALRRTGVVVVDAEPSSLSPAVVNQYLDIKTTGRL